MCTIKFSIWLDTFQIDDKDLTTNNICEKSAQTVKMDDASVHHPPVYVSFFEDSPVRHPSGKVLMKNSTLTRGCCILNELVNSYIKNWNCVKNIFNFFFLGVNTGNLGVLAFKGGGYNFAAKFLEISVEMFIYSSSVNKEEKVRLLSCGLDNFNFCISS